MKTFIRWQGNKSKHINKFIKYIPDDVVSGDFNGTYIEPFIGSGSLFLKLEPRKWIINDLNKDLINVWNQVKKNPESIISFFKRFGKSFKVLSKENKMKKGKGELLKMEKLDYNEKRAHLFMILKEISYMGNIVIKNKLYFPSLDINITLNNQYSFLNQSKFDSFLNASAYLNKSKGKIYNMDYKRVLQKAKKNDFVFLDPPYIENKDYQFNYNTKEILDNLFLDELLKQVKILDKKGVRWLMTQADTKSIKTIFKEYKIKKFKVYRAQAKKYINELVIMNY